MLDWCLQWVPQIQQGFQIKSYGMIFITRPTYLAVLMGKECLYFSNKNTSSGTPTVSRPDRLAMHVNVLLVNVLRQNCVT